MDSYLCYFRNAHTQCVTPSTWCSEKKAVLSRRHIFNHNFDGLSEPSIVFLCWLSIVLLLQVWMLDLYLEGGITENPSFTFISNQKPFNFKTEDDFVYKTKFIFKSWIIMVFSSGSRSEYVGDWWKYFRVEQLKDSACCLFSPFEFDLTQAFYCEQRSPTAARSVHFHLERFPPWEWVGLANLVDFSTRQLGYIYIYIPTPSLGME